MTRLYKKGTKTITQGSLLCKTPTKPIYVPGVQLWLDAADANTITLNGSNVTQWDDKSGNGYTPLQATASNQPTYQTAVQNGLNVVRFDGNDFLTQNPYTWPTQNITIFIVQKTTTVTSSTVFRTDPNDGVNRISFHTPWSNNTVYWDFGNISGGGRLTYTFDGGTAFNMFTFINESGVGQEIWRNRVLKASAGTTDDFDNSGNPNLRIGDAFNGDVAEIAVFNRILTNTEKYGLESYLLNKWGI